MQVTCPSCGARYAVDPLAIGPVGRIVQCARCAHRWHQKVVAASATATMMPTPVRREIGEPVPDIVIRPPRQRSTLPVPVEPRAPRFWNGTSALVTAGVIAAMLLVAVGFYFFHDEIVAKVPAEWRAMLSLRA